MKQFLEENYLESIPIKQLSRQFGINECDLKRSFKMEFNNTIFGFVQQLRMERAKQELLAGKSIKEVAFEIGYEHPHHFSTAFRKWYHIPPSRLVAFHQLVGLHNVIEPEYAAYVELYPAGLYRLNELPEDLGRTPDLPAVVDGQVDRGGDEVHGRKRRDRPLLRQHACHAGGSSRFGAGRGVFQRGRTDQVQHLIHACGKKSPYFFL